MLQQAVLTLEVTEADITPLAKFVDLEERVQTFEARRLKRRASASRRNSLGGAGTRGSAAPDARDGPAQAQAKEAAARAARLRLMNRLLGRACDAVTVLSVGREPAPRLPARSAKLRLEQVPAFALLHEAALVRSTGTGGDSDEPKSGSKRAFASSPRPDSGSASPEEDAAREAAERRRQALSATKAVVVMGEVGAMVAAAPSASASQSGRAGAGGDAKGGAGGGEEETMNHRSSALSSAAGMMVDVGSTSVSLVAAGVGAAAAAVAPSAGQGHHPRRASLPTALLAAAGQFGRQRHLMAQRPEHAVPHPLLAAAAREEASGGAARLADPGGVTTLRREELLIVRTPVEAASLRPSWQQVFRLRLYALQPDTVVQLSLFALASRSDIGGEGSDEEESGSDEEGGESGTEEDYDEAGDDGGSDDNDGGGSGHNGSEGDDAAGGRASPRSVDSDQLRRNRAKQARHRRRLVAQRRRRPFLLGTAVLRIGRAVFSAPRGGSAPAPAMPSSVVGMSTRGPASRRGERPASIASLSPRAADAHGALVPFAGAEGGGGAARPVVDTGSPRPPSGGTASSVSPRGILTPPAAPPRSRSPRPPPDGPRGAGSPRSPALSPRAPPPSIARTVSASSSAGGSSRSDPLRGWHIRPPTRMTLADVAPFLPVHRNDEPASQVFGVPPGTTGSWTVSPRDAGMGEISLRGGVADRPPPSWAVVSRLAAQPALRGRLLQWSSAVYRWALLASLRAVSAPRPPLEVTDPALFTVAQLQSSDLYASADAGDADGALTTAQIRRDASRWLVPGAVVATTTTQGAALAAEAAASKSCAVALLARRLHTAALIGVEGTPLPSGAPEAWRLVHEGAPVRLQEDSIGRLNPDKAGGSASVVLGEAVGASLRTERKRAAARAGAIAGGAIRAEGTRLSDDDDDDDDDDGVSAMGDDDGASAALRRGSVADSEVSEQGGDVLGALSSPSGPSLGPEGWPLGLPSSLPRSQVAVASGDRQTIADETARGGTLERLMGPLGRPAAAQRTHRVKQYNPHGAGSAGRWHSAAIAKNEPSVTAVLAPGTVARPVFAEVDLLVAPPAELVRAARPAVQNLLREALTPGSGSREAVLRLARYMTRHGRAAGGSTPGGGGGGAAAGSAGQQQRKGGAGAQGSADSAAPGPPVLRVRWRLDVDADPSATRGAEALFRIGVRRGSALTLLPNKHLSALAAAVETPPVNDIVKHLPVLKPLFRHVATLSEQRVSTTGPGVFAAIKGTDPAAEAAAARTAAKQRAAAKQQALRRSTRRGGVALRTARRRGASRGASRGSSAASARGALSPSGLSARGGGRVTTPVPGSPIRAPAGGPSSRQGGRAAEPDAQPTFTQRVARRIMGRLRMLKLMGLVPSDVANGAGLAGRGLLTASPVAGAARGGAGAMVAAKPSRDKPGDLSAQARRRRRGQPPILMTHTSEGIPAFVFVGLLGLLTTLPREALEDAFRRMDANADGDLTFSELIAFLLREADVALTFKASQDSYLLEPPLADDPTSTALISRPGGLLGFVTLTPLQGYALSFADGALRVFDDELRPGLALDTAHVPAPVPDQLPFDAVPETVPGQRIRAPGRGRAGGAAGRKTPRHDRPPSPLRATRSFRGRGGAASRVIVITQADAESASRREDAAASDRSARLRRRREEQQHRIEAAKLKSLGRAGAQGVRLGAVASRTPSGSRGSATTAADADGGSGQAGGAAEPEVSIDEMTHAEIKQKARALQLQLTGGGGDGDGGGGMDGGAGASRGDAGVSAGAESARTILAVVFDEDASRLLAVRADRVVLVFDLTPFRADGPTPLRELAAQLTADMTAADVRGVKEARMQALARAAGASGPRHTVGQHGLKGLVDGDGHVTGRAAIALARSAGLDRPRAGAGGGPSSPTAGGADAGGEGDVWLGGQERWEAARRRGLAEEEGGSALSLAMRIQAARKVAVAGREEETRLGGVAASGRRGRRGHGSADGSKLAMKRDRGIAPVILGSSGAVSGDAAGGGGASDSAASRAVSGAVAAALAARGLAGDTVVDASESGRATGVGMSRLAASGAQGGRSGGGGGGGGGRSGGGASGRGGLGGSSGQADRSGGAQLGGGSDDRGMGNGLDRRGLLLGTSRGGGSGAVMSRASRGGVFGPHRSEADEEERSAREAGIRVTRPPVRAARGHVQGDGVRAGRAGHGTEIALGRAKGTEVRLGGPGGGILRLEGGPGEIAGTTDEADERDVKRVITGSLATAAGDSGRVASVVVPCRRSFGVGPGIPTRMLVTSTGEAARGPGALASASRATASRVYAVGDSMGWVTLYDCETLTLVGACETPLEGVTGMVAVPGLGIAVAGHGGGIQVVDPRTATVSKAFVAAHPLGITALALCQGEQLLVTAGYDSRLLCWDAHGTTAQPVAELSSGTPPVLKRSEGGGAGGDGGDAGGGGGGGGGDGAGSLADGLADTSGADRVIELAVAEAHAMILAITAAGRVEVYDPKTLQLTQRLHDRLSSSTRGIIVDAQRLVVATFGSHLRLWRIREVDGNTLTAAQAALRAVAAGPGSALAAAQREDRERDAVVPERRVAIVDPTVSDVGISGTSPRAMGGRAARGGLSNGSPVPHRRLSDIAKKRRGGGLVVTTKDASAAIALAGAPGGGGGGSDPQSPRQSRADTVLGELLQAAEDSGQDPTRGRRGSGLVGGDGAVARGAAGGPAGAARRNSAVQLESAMEDARRRLQLRRGSVEERAVRNLVTEATERAAQLRVSDADAVLCALYSDSFGVVVTVRFGGRVATWDVRTGEVRATFRVSHRNIAATGAMGGDDGTATSAGTGRVLRLGTTFKPADIELTAASLDAHGRRLLTGGIDGSVRMWSIANGDLVRSLPPVSSEVTAVTFHTAVGLTRPVVAGAWAGEVAFWRDAGEAAVVAPKPRGAGAGDGAAPRDAGDEAAAEALQGLGSYGGVDDDAAPGEEVTRAVVIRDSDSSDGSGGGDSGGFSDDDDDDAPDMPLVDLGTAGGRTKGQVRRRDRRRAAAARNAVDAAIGHRAALSGYDGVAEPGAGGRRTVPRWKPATGGAHAGMSLLHRRVDDIRGRITLVRSHWGGSGMSPQEAQALTRRAEARGHKARTRQRRPSVEGDQLSQDVPLSIFDGDGGAGDDDNGDGGMLPRRGAGISGRGTTVASADPDSLQHNPAHVERVPLARRLTTQVLDARPPKIDSISELVLTAHWARALRRVLRNRVDASRLEREQKSRLIELSVAKDGRDVEGSKKAAKAAKAAKARGAADAGATVTRPRRPSAVAKPLSAMLKPPPAAGEAAKDPVSSPGGTARTALLRTLMRRPDSVVPGLDLSRVGRGGSGAGSIRVGGSARAVLSGSVHARVDSSAPQTMRVSERLADTENEDRVLDAAAMLAEMMDHLVFGGAGAAARAARRKASASKSEGSGHGDVLCVASGGGRPVVAHDGSADDADGDEGPAAAGRRALIGNTGSAVSQHGAAWVVTGSSDGQLCLWDAVTERPSSSRVVHDASGVGTLRPASVWAVCGLAKQRVVVAGTDGGCLHVLDVVSGHMVQHQPVTGDAAGAGAASLSSPSGGAVMPFGGGGGGGAGLGAQGSAWSRARKAVQAAPSALVSDTLRTGFRPLPRSESWGAPAAHGVTAMAADSLEHVMMVGYAHGWARIFDVSALAARPHTLERPLHEFVVSGGGFSVRSVSFVQLRGTEPLFVTCSGIDVSLWTRQGSHVARFGQAASWPKVLGHDAHAKRITRASLALGIASADDVAGAVRRSSILLAKGRRRGPPAAQEASALGMLGGAVAPPPQGNAGGPEHQGATGASALVRPPALAGSPFAAPAETPRFAFGGDGARARPRVAPPPSSAPKPWLAIRSSRRRQNKLKAQELARGAAPGSVLAAAPQSRGATSPTARFREKGLLSRAAAEEGATPGSGLLRAMGPPARGGRRGSTSAKLEEEAAAAAAAKREEERAADAERWKESTRTAAGRRLLPGPDALVTDAMWRRTSHLGEEGKGAEAADEAGAGDDADGEAGRPHRPPSGPTPRDAARGGRTGRRPRLDEMVGAPLGDEEVRMRVDAEAAARTSEAGRPLPRHARVQREYVGAGVWRRVPMDAPRNHEGYSEAAEARKAGAIDHLAATLDAAERQAAALR